MIVRTSRPLSRVFWDAFGGRNWSGLDMHLDAEIECTQICEGRPWSSKFGEALGGRDRVSSEMHFQTVIERVWRCTRSSILIRIGGVLGGRRSEGGGSGRRRNGSWDYINWSTCDYGNVENRVWQSPPGGKMRLAGSGRQSIFGWCMTHCMLGDGGNHHQKLGLTEFRVQVNWPSLIWDVQVLIQRVITPIWSLPNPIRHIIPLISRIHSYPPYCSHLHSPSHFLGHNSPIIAEHKVKLSISLSPCHDYELTLCTAHTEYSIHRVQRSPHTASGW